MTGPARETAGNSRLDGAMQAIVAEWLYRSRRESAPILDFPYPVPSAALLAARRRGLFGVTGEDAKRLLEEMAARSAPRSDEGRPDPVGQLTRD